MARHTAHDTHAIAPCAITQNKQPDLPPTVKYQAKLQKLDRYCNLFNLRATSADHRDAAPRREREKSKGRDRDGRKRTKEKKEKKKEKKKSEREKRREKERAKGKEKEKDRDNEKERTRRKRKEDDERRNRDEEEERRDDDAKERRRTETDRGRGKTKTDRDERSRTRASELHPPPPRKRGLSRGKKRVSPDTILAMLEDKKRPRVEAPTELDQATSATSTKSKPTSPPMTITMVSTTSTMTRRPVAPAMSSSSSTILRSSRRVGATALSLSRRLQAKEDHATIEGAGVVTDVGSRDARQADSARLGLVDEFKVPRGTTAPRSKAAPVGDDVTALLVPVTPDTSPEKPSQQRLRGSQGESARARAQRGLDDEVTAQAAIANASESEPLFSPLSVVPQTPDSELWAHKERNTKKTKNETERTKTRSDLCGFGAKRQEEKKKREERSAKEESIVSAVENAKHADHEATQRKVVEEDSVDVIPETPEEQVRPPAKTVQRRKKERLRPKTISTLADKLDEGLEVVAETQMTAAMSTASMPHFAAVSLGSHASMPVTCAQAPSSSDKEASDDEDDIVTDTTTIQAKSASGAEKTNVNNAEKRKWPNDDGGDGDEEELSLHFSLSLWSPAASMAAPSQPFASARHRDSEEFLARNDHRPRRQPQTKRSAAVGQPQQPLTSSELSLPLLSAESPTKDLAGNGGIGQALAMASERKNEKRQSPEGLEEQASIEVSEELMVEASNALLVSTVEDDVTNPAPPAEKNEGLEQKNKDEGEEDDEEKRKKEMDEEEQVRVIRERMMQRKRDKREALQRQPSMDLLSCTPYPASARQVADKAAATPPPPELLEPSPPQLALQLESIVEHAQIKLPEAVEAAIAENEALNDVAEPESVGSALLPTHEPLVPAGLYRWALVLNPT